MTVTLLPRQTLPGSINELRSTVSSWDRCMSKAYCKWPVIAALISAGLIALIVAWCVFGCVCYGTTCCCRFWCCGDGRRRHRQNDGRPKSLDPSPASPQHPVNEDALPPMPTWQTAQERRIVEERKAQAVYVEMNSLHASPSPPISPTAPNRYVQTQPTPHAPPVYESSNPYSYPTAAAGGVAGYDHAAANSPYLHHHQHQHQHQQYLPQLPTGAAAAGSHYDLHQNVVSPVSPSTYSHSPYHSPLQEPRRYDISGSRQMGVLPVSRGSPALARPLAGGSGGVF